MTVSRVECRLRHLRQRAGFRQIDVARMTGYSKQMIYKFENNITPMSPEAMYTVSKAIGCRMEELYVWSDELV